jgi:hypothetical protein
LGEGENRAGQRQKRHQGNDNDQDLLGFAHLYTSDAETPARNPVNFVAERYQIIVLRL